MTYWRTTGCVPDSEGDEDEDIPFSPPATQPISASQNGDKSPGLGPETKQNAHLDIFDFPSSSAEQDDATNSLTSQRQVAAPRRGRSAKRLSVESSSRPKKQARVEKPAEQSRLPVAASIPALSLRETVATNISSPFRSPASRLLNQLDSLRNNDKSESTLQSTIFDGTQLGSTPSKPAGSGLEVVVHPKSVLPINTDEFELINLVDEHGPFSQDEIDVSEAQIPASSPPSVLNLEKAFESPVPQRQPSNLTFEIIIPSPRKSTTESLLPIEPNFDSGAEISILPDDGFTTGIIRNLRERKPIQVNPYMVEEQRYKSTMASRGIRPVRFVQNDPILLSNKKTTDGESQDDDFALPNLEKETQGSLSILLRNDSMDIDSTDAENQAEPNHRHIDSNQNKKTAEGKKRQRMRDPFKPTAKSKAITEHARALLAKGDDVVSDATGSALKPQTPNPSKGRTRDIFDLLATSSDLEPSPQKTPKSTARRRVILESSDDDDVDSGVIGDTTPRANSPHSSSSESTASSESEPEPEYQARLLEKMRRRVRGVLPASYLRLNNPTEKTNAERQAITRQHSPENRAFVPGMAQMRIRKRSSPSPGSAANPLRFSDDDESSENEPISLPGLLNAPNSTLPTSIHRFPHVSRATLSYSFEDNSFDRMLSRPTRPQKEGPSGYKSSKTKNLKQARLNTSSDSAHRTRPQGRRNTLTRPKVKAAAMSAVDACKSYQRTKGAKPPQFMRVAARQANSQKNKGRHLPDRKVIKFDDYFEDNETEGEATLAKWKRAKLSRSSSITSAADSKEIETRRLPRTSSKIAPLFNASSSSLKQTRLPFQTPDHPAINKSGSKPKVKYKSMPPKPLAIINRNQPHRIESILKKLTASKFDDPIEPSSPVSPSPLSRISYQNPSPPPVVSRMEQRSYKSSHANHIVRPQQFFVNAHSETFDKAGKKQTNATKRSRKNQPHRRILRRKSPSAFQPPERIVLPTHDIEIHSDEEASIAFENMPPSTQPFSRDFGIRVDVQKVIFHESTFIGGGFFAKALNTTPGQSYPRSSSVQSQSFFGIDLDWKSYNEVVGAQFEDVMLHFMEVIESNLSGFKENEALTSFQLVLEMKRLLKFIAFYLSQNIYFPDIIDISSFTTRFVDILSIVSAKAAAIEFTDESAPGQRPSGLLKLEIYCFLSVVLHQLLHLGQSDDAKVTLGQLQKERNSALEGLISTLIRFGDAVLQTALASAGHATYTDGKLNDNVMILEAWVIAYRIAISGGLAFWDKVNRCIALATIKCSKDVAVMESTWRSLFRMLPLATINDVGLCSPLKTDAVLAENWKFVKDMVFRATEIYNGLRSKSAPLANPYIKALYGRCLILMKDWKWSNPDAIIVSLYDFFAKRRLHNLGRENDRGSPEFLQNLDSPSFDLRPEETCFTILLKCVAVVVQRTRKISGEKAVDDLCIRLLPNHGRIFLKEEALPIDDFNALRNHHDLLTAIYYGVGPTKKKRIISITRGLVDPAKSHSNVCSLSLRTWANMINFELSDEKSTAILEELMKWHSNIVQKTIELHRGLRAQEETAEREMKDTDELHEFKRNVGSNKRSLEAILSTAVELLDTIVNSPNCDFYSAQILLSSDSMSRIFAASQGLTPNLVTGAVKIVSSHVSLCKNFGYTGVQDESQTWAGFDDVESDETRKKAAERLQTQIYESFFNLIKSYFASEKKPLDQVLISCTQVWIELGSLLVQCGLKKWDDYFNPYQKGSWFSMIKSDTMNTFSVYYVGNIMKIEPEVYDSHRQIILETWVASIVERDSMLKFQHELTMTLFNHDVSNVLFANMPFEVKDESYDISFRDFKERRLLLISTLLDNMQREALRHPTSPSIKTEYVPMLQTMMQAMKQNYTVILSHQKPTRGNNFTVDNRETSAVAQSAYVGFCQKVVELLQQYTVDIAAVDKFFTDSVAFPLPINDPVYLTSRLKRYAMKLGTQKGVVTQILSFFRNMCTRVAVEGEQGYFVNQMLAAFEEQSERQAKVEGRQTLQQICVCAMFTVYIKRSMEGLVNMILAAPIIVTAEKVIRGLVRDIDTFDENTDVDNHIAEYLVSVLEAVRLTLGRCTDGLGEPLGLFILGLLARLVVECDLLITFLLPRAVHITDGISVAFDLLRTVTRELSRLRAWIATEDVPERLEITMMDLDLPLKEEMRKFEEEYKHEMQSWRVRNGEIWSEKPGSKKLVGWRHLLPYDSTVEDLQMGKKLLLDKLELALARISLGACGQDVREVDAATWDKARRPMVRVEGYMYTNWKGEPDREKERAICVEEGDDDDNGVFDLDD